jgi:hypothetical protein
MTPVKPILNVPWKIAALWAALLPGAWGTAWTAEAPRNVSPAAEARSESSHWVEPMKKVHARFTGEKGTFAHFGDSITVTMAFWAPLTGNPKNMSAEMARAHQLVKGYQKTECWSQWKGPEFGNNGSMTIRWAHENAGKWLTKLNPEVVLIMFGSNDVGQMAVTEYETKTREVVARCLSNGSIVILSTMPPRSGRVEKSRQFADVVSKIAREQNVPLVDYFGEIFKRRPEDWDGALPKFKGLPGDEYQVSTLVARDGVHPSNPKQFAGDFSDEALRSSGYGLRNFLTMMAYAAVIEKILQPNK